MEYLGNRKVLGSLVIGIALVGGAYTLSTFGESSFTPTQLVATATEAPPRVFIPVSDTDEDGVEDWRDQFLSAAPITVSELATVEYTPPDTVTGQFGVALMEEVILAELGGPFTKETDQITSDAAERLKKVVTNDTIYTIKDIRISSVSSDQTIREYGNALAKILLDSSDPNLRNEIVILAEFVTDKRTDNSEELQKIASIYKDYRDKTLALPVPRKFTKEHLDLVNVYHALYMNIDAMTKVNSDPVLPFLRLKRYEDDVAGLGLALRNVYDALVPYARVFSVDDEAVYLVNFSQVLQ